jgi:hypothetical protein
MDGAHQGAPRHRQAEPIREDRLDLAERQSELLVETRRDGHGLRAQLYGRRTDRIGRLQGVATLHAAAASTTATAVHIEPAHHRPHGREIFLILRRHMGVVDRPTALRAGRRHRHVLHVIDDGGRRALALSTIRRSRLSAGPPRRSARRAFRERRGLPIAGSTRRLQLLPQPLVFAAQSITFSLDAFEIATQPLDFLPPRLGTRWRVGPDWAIGALTHAPVMPESARQYKSNPVINYPLGKDIRINQMKARLR